MAVYEYFRIHYSRFHDLVLFRRREKKRPQIVSMLQPPSIISNVPLTSHDSLHRSISGGKTPSCRELAMMSKFWHASIRCIRLSSNKRPSRMSVLREQAIASRIAVADEYTGIPHSRTAPPRPLLPGDALSSSPPRLSSSPVSPISMQSGML